MTKSQSQKEAASARANMMSSTVFGLFLSCVTHHELPLRYRKHGCCHMHVFIKHCADQKQFFDMSCSQAQDHAHRRLQRNNTHDVCDTMSPNRKKHATHHTNGMSSHDVPRQEKEPRLLDVTGQRTAGHVPSHLLRCKTNPENKYGPTTSTNRTSNAHLQKTWFDNYRICQEQ